MDKKIKPPSMNAFFIEDPDNPDNLAIPVVVINGDTIKLINIRDDRLDFFRPIVANISKEIGAKSYFATYDTPTSIEEIEPVDDPNLSSITIDTNGSPRKASEIIEKLVEIVDEILVKKLGPKQQDKPDEDTVH